MVMGFSANSFEDGFQALLDWMLYFVVYSDVGFKI
jgi:hypothetical protein